MAEPVLVYADADIAVVSKPSGMVVHPGTHHKDEHLLGWLKDALAPLPLYGSIAPAHRIDKDTSGLVLFGRHKAALAGLESAFKNQQVEKIYLALVQGVTHRKGRITKSLKRRDGNGVESAETHYRRLRYSRAATVVRAKLVTGRTHQIRRHFNGIGHSVAGDTRWGNDGFNRYMQREHGLERLFLHAASLSFVHPASKETVSFVAPLPEALLKIVEKLSIPELPSPWGVEGA